MCNACDVTFYLFLTDNLMKPQRTFFPRRTDVKKSDELQGIVSLKENFLNLFLTEIVTNHEKQLMLYHHNHSLLPVNASQMFTLDTFQGIISGASLIGFC